MFRKSTISPFAWNFTASAVKVVAALRTPNRFDEPVVLLLIVWASFYGAVWTVNTRNGFLDRFAEGGSISLPNLFIVALGWVLLFIVAVYLAKLAARLKKGEHLGASLGVQGVALAGPTLALYVIAPGWDTVATLQLLATALLVWLDCHEELTTELHLAFGSMIFAVQAESAVARTSFATTYLAPFGVLATTHTVAGVGHARSKWPSPCPGDGRFTFRLWLPLPPCPYLAPSQA